MPHTLTVLFPSGVVVRSVRDRRGYLLSLTPRQTEKFLAIERSLATIVLARVMLRMKVRLSLLLIAFVRHGFMAVFVI